MLFVCWQKVYPTSLGSSITVRLVCLQCQSFFFLFLIYCVMCKGALIVRKAVPFEQKL